MNIKKLPPTMLAALGFGASATPGCVATACLDVASSAPVTESSETMGPCLAPMQTTVDTTTETATDTSGSTDESTTVGGCLEPPLTTTGSDSGSSSGTDTDTDTDTGTGTDTDGTSSGSGGQADRASVLQSVLDRDVLPADVAAKLAGK